MSESGLVKLLIVVVFIALMLGHLLLWFMERRRMRNQRALDELMDLVEEILGEAVTNKTRELDGEG